MNFDQLNTFITVVETGSFQKTASLEYISQRAVSQSMKKLEDELGFKLFVRGKNKISITNQGQEFYLKAKDVIHSLNVEINSLKNHQANEYTELKIGYFSPFEGALLTDQIILCKKKHPKINFKITEESIEHLISDVSIGILDLAYILDYGSQEFLNSNLTNQSVYKSKMLIGISKLDPLSTEAEFPLSALREKPILYYSSEKSNYLKQGFLSTLPDNYHNLSVARISTIEQMQMLVSTNQAYAYYPDGLVKKALTLDSNIKYLPIAGENNTQYFKIQAIYRKNDKNKILKDFLELN